MSIILPFINYYLSVLFHLITKYTIIANNIEHKL
jgi:hypothetical protein